MRFSLEQYIGLSNVWESYLKQSWEESGGNLCDGHFIGIFFIIILNLLSLLIPKLVRHVKAELCWLQPSAHATAASVRTEEFFFGSGIGKARLLHSLTLLPSLGEQLLYKQNKKLYLQTLMLTSAHHPVRTVITKANVGMAVRDNGRESKS